MKPVFQAAVPSGSIMWNLCWNPHYPCNFIITGCADGTVALWNITDTPTSPVLIATDTQMRSSVINDSGNDIDEEGHPGNFKLKKGALESVPVFHIKAAKTCLRGIAWSLTNPSVFATCGQDSVLKIWDRKDPFTPIAKYQKSGLAMSIAWGALDYPVLFYGCDDGCIGHLDFEPKGTVKEKHATFFKYDEYNIWGIDYSKFIRQSVSCSSGGSLISYPATRHLHKMKANARPPPLVVEKIHLLDDTINFARDYMVANTEYASEAAKKARERVNPTQKKIEKEDFFKKR